MQHFCVILFYTLSFKSGGNNMAFSDTRIHQIELLLTLDYLLRFTDEDHPATREDICRHANDFGLKYDSKAKSGNDVRRQRISDCLKFLMDVTTKFSEEVPFVLETTPVNHGLILYKNHGQFCTFN